MGVGLVAGGVEIASCSLDEFAQSGLATAVERVRLEIDHGLERAVCWGGAHRVHVPSIRDAKKEDNQRVQG